MSDYIFTDTQHTSELERLQAIEQVFDPATRRRLQATGVTTGWQCLEVGAGAGSITRWLAEIVGSRGNVVAIDLDTRFLTTIDLPNVTVLTADIRDASLTPHTFDLIHARYVLIHNPDAVVILAAMLELLKPGGWLVLEEPDFSAARAIVGDKVACQAMDRVNQAIVQMFTNRGMDAALGVKLPAMLQAQGLPPLLVENDAHLAMGGSGIAAIMKMSARQLANAYVATGTTTHDDIEQYCHIANDRTTWAVYYATIAITTQKLEVT